MNELVSIIVTCYNYAQYLDEALLSVVEQTHKHWECIIVDDGSSDNTVEIANKWCEKDDRFIYLYKENGGVSSARNLGIKNANGAFIVTLDADDKYDKTFIEKAISVIIENDEIGVVSCWGICFINDKQLSENRPTGRSILDFLFKNAAIGTSLFRKECWEKAGGYDGDSANGYEDWEFYISVCKLGWKVFIIEESLFFYRQHEKGSRRTRMNQQYKDNMAYIYIKHKDLYLSHYEDFVNHFLGSIESEKKEYLKIKNKIEFKIGTAILKPFRFIKSFIKK